MKELLFGQKTLIMGIVNVTPDSFYDGGRHDTVESGFLHAIKLLNEGADIIDIGGESSRPGAIEVSAQQECDRVCPVIEKTLSENPDAFISIDTVKPEVAAESLRLGARMVNDISGRSCSNGIARLCARHGAYLVLMHMRGTPGTMQNDTGYKDLFSEVFSFLEKTAADAVDEGVSKSNIVIDPGIGFAKTTEQNYELIAECSSFKKAGYPLLMALSRKSLIGNILGKDEDRLPSTIALNAISAFIGADIIRVHDVKEHVLALKTVDMLRRTA